jgi:hypothetical protein
MKEADMRIEFEKRCTSENAAMIRARLIEALQTPEGAELDFTSVAEADMTFFLLVIAAKRAFAKAGKPLALSFEPGAGSEAFCRHAGLMRLDRPAGGRAA